MPELVIHLNYLVKSSVSPKNHFVALKGMREKLEWTLVAQ